MTKEDRSCCFRALVTKRLRFNLSSSWIDDSNLLVFTCRHELRPVPVETSTKDDVGMTVHVDENLSGPDIPNDNLIIGASRQQNI